MRRFMLAVVLCASPALAADLLVPSQFATIQAAVNAASNGDTVIVAPGTYAEHVDLSGKQITLRSSGGRDVTIIDGTSTGRVITAMGSETVAGTLVEGFTIRNGSADSGAGLLIQSPAGLSVRDCAFENNVATVQGGGVHMHSPGFDTLIEDCTFNANTAPNGGGMSISAAFAIVRGCEFTDNLANEAGGGDGAGLRIFNFGNSTVEDCVFDGNFFQNTFGNGGTGGGIAIEHASARVIGCTFRNHNAFRGGGTGGRGGGLWAQTNPGQPPRDIFVRDCLFESNTAGVDGGGMYLQGMRSDVAGCRFVNNTTANTTGGGGGGLFIVGEAGGRFDGCEFIANTGAFGGGMAASTFSNYILANSLFAGNNATLAPLGAGGGLYSSGTTSTIVNCSFVSNTCNSPAGGGGLDVTPSGSSRADNLIVWGNSPLQIATSFGATFPVSYSTVQGGYTGMGNLAADPMFVDADGPDNNPGTFIDNDYRLAMGSPAIDAGNNAALPQDFLDRDGDNNFNELLPWDVEANERFVDEPMTADTGGGTAPIVDMGAYEVQVAAACPGDIADDFGSLNGGDGMVSFGDFLALLGLVGPCPGMTPGCDGDIADDFGSLGGDGQVSFGDFLALLGLVGPCP